MQSQSTVSVNRELIGIERSSSACGGGGPQQESYSQSPTDCLVRGASRALLWQRTNARRPQKPVDQSSACATKIYLRPKEPAPVQGVKAASYQKLSIHRVNVTPEDFSCRGLPTHISVRHSNPPGAVGGMVRTTVQISKTRFEIFAVP